MDELQLFMKEISFDILCINETRFNNTIFAIGAILVDFQNRRGNCSIKFIFLILWRIEPKTVNYPVTTVIIRHSILIK
jgi:hypothetical protein